MARHYPVPPSPTAVNAFVARFGLRTRVTSSEAHVDTPKDPSPRDLSGGRSRTAEGTIDRHTEIRSQRSRHLTTLHQGRSAPIPLRIVRVNTPRVFYRGSCILEESVTTDYNNNNDNNNNRLLTLCTSSNNSVTTVHPLLSTFDQLSPSIFRSKVTF